MTECGLERLIGQERYERLRADPHFDAAVDSAATNLYSFVVGGMIDAATIHDWIGVGVSRANSLWLNTATARRWQLRRDQVYKNRKITEKSSKSEKAKANLVAFNTFQVPLYLVLNFGGAIAREITKGDFDLSSLYSAFTTSVKGAGILMGLSPFIGPTMGYWQDATRRFCGLKTSGELAAETQIPVNPNKLELNTGFYNIKKDDGSISTKNEK